VSGVGQAFIRYKEKITMPIIETKKIIDGEEITIHIEVDETPMIPEWPHGEMRGPRTERVVEAVRDVFDDGMKLVRNCAAHVVDSIKAMSDAIRPEEFELQLTIKLDSEVGAVLVKASTGAQMQVKLKWCPRKS
jgi:NTP-dependent ternary system trypsin peptidase co-occuring protein